MSLSMIQELIELRPHIPFLGPSKKNDVGLAISVEFRTYQ
jgi:hypothetical protein